MEPIQEYRSFKTHAITVIITFIVSYIAVTSGAKVQHTKLYNEFKSRQATRDSIIQADSIAIRELQIERDSLLVVQELINTKLDSSISEIKSHTVVTVSDEDVIEALKWIKESQVPTQE